MTIHLTSLPHEDRALDARSAASNNVGTHLFVGSAIVIVGSGLAIFMAQKLELSPLIAATSGIAFGLGAGILHLKLSRPAPLKPATRAKKAPRRTPTLDGIEPGIVAGEFAAPAPVLVQSAASAPPAPAPSVEPSDLALALLASLKASSEVAPVGEAHAPEAWTWALAAQLPAEPQASPQHYRDPHGEAQFEAPAATPPQAGHYDPAFVQAGNSGEFESEVERVDRLVKRLADNVNQLQAMRHAEPEPQQLGLFPDESDANHQIEESINALRRANAAAAVTPVAEVVPPPAPPAHSWEKPEVQKYSDTYSELQRSSILSALNAQRIDVFLEPILDLHEQRPEHYEVSIALRTAGGHAINLAEAASDLSGTGLLPLIDQARIARAGQIARRLADRGKMGAVFTELNGETLVDGGFQETFANDTISVGAFPGQLVLTLPQAHVMTFTTADWRTLARLAEAGFGFALTDVTTLDMDFARLAEAGFVFARLDAETFLIGLPTAGGTVPPQDICRHLAQSGLMLIVGGILDDNQLARIFGFGVLFGQGQLFGAPRAMKPDAASMVAANNGHSPAVSAAE